MYISKEATYSMRNVYTCKEDFIVLSFSMNVHVIKMQYRLILFFTKLLWKHDIIATSNNQFLNETKEIPLEEWDNTKRESSKFFIAKM